MKKAIITGANGFVGSWLVKTLSENMVHVTAIIRNESEDVSEISTCDNINIVYCDLSELNSLVSLISERDYDVFYHLAWVSAGGVGRADYNVQLNNVKYACDAVKVASILGCKKILFAGTVSEHLVDNVANLNAKAQNNVYAVCKHTTRCLVNIECEKYGINCVWMQFSNLFGPGSLNGNIVGYTIRELLAGHDATFGPATQLYDLLYIKDLVVAAFLLGKCDTKLKIYYIGSGMPMVLKDYLLEIGKLMGMQERIKIGVREDDGTRYSKDWFDINPLVKDTGYSPSSKFREGILETINWMMSNK